MKKTALRWFGFGVPLACVAGIIFGDFESTSLMILGYMIFQLGALAAPDAFCRAAAGLVSTKKVKGSLLLAVALSLIPAAVMFFTVCRADLRQLIVLAPIALTVILRCLEEYFSSQGDTTSAAITTALTAILLGSALSLVGNHSFGDPESSAELGATGLSALISGGVALAFSRREQPGFSCAVLKQIPAALGRLLTYPALCLGLLRLNAIGQRLPVGRAAVLGGLAGLILLELTRTTFRRDKSESAGLKVGIAVATLLFGGGFALWSLFDWSLSVLMAESLGLAAGAAALLLYAPWNWESIAAEIVLLAASAALVIGITPQSWSFPYEIFIAPAAGLALCLIMLRQWAELARLARVRRIRRRALKNSR